jgi:glycosyltransferase involved in cell wall biosynthesis
LDNGKYGILVPPEDEEALAKAIVEVLTDEDLRTKLSQMSIKRASAFTLKTMLRKYEDIFTTGF